MKTARSSGIILHITSLPGSFGIGDLGPSAYRFADFLRESGVRFWQLLPLNPIEQRTGYSPYSSTSAFAGNTMLVSPELLVQEGFLQKKDIKIKDDFNDEAVEFEKAILFKKGILRKAFQNFKAEADKEKTKAYNDFCKKYVDWLDDYALFTVLDQVFEQASWLDWPEAIRNREVNALSEITKQQAEELDYVRFTQFLFYRQWENLRKYCNERNVYFFGDLPFYVSFDSADVWSNPDNFKLDKEKKPVSVSGVPPDYFSKTGQLWGTPVYNWPKLKKNKFDWWIRRLAHNLELFDVARLDHFRAFYDYWEVPAGEETAVNGNWQMGPADDFFKLLQKTFPDMPFIAEDLGDVNQGVYDLRDRWNLPGMTVLQYAFGADISTSSFATHNLKENMVAYTGTHDNNTTKGWFRKELKDDDKARLNEYLNYKITAQNASEALIKLALMSVAKLAIFPIQDFLNLDEKAIMNKPSVGEGNWRWRLTEEQLKTLEPNELKEMLTLYNRVPKEN